MSLSWIGALVAFALPRAKTPDDAVERLRKQVEGMVEMREQLIAYTELLESELATQRSLTDHWLKELQRTIRERREIEEERDRLRAQRTQNEQALAHKIVALGARQAAQTQQNAFNRQFDGFCNCVPGRSQALVNRLDPT